MVSRRSVVDGRPVPGAGASAVSRRRLGAGVVVVMIAAVVGVRACAWAEDFAVLVGVGAYRESAWRALKAPVNDVTLMWDWCRRASISLARTTVLLNQDATKAAMLEAFAQVAQRARRGDRFVFYFSGHGVLVADVFGPHRGDELTHFPPDTDDEALVPYDARPATPSSFLIDDEIADALRPIVRRRVRVLCILDCCVAYDGIKAGEEDIGDAKTLSTAPVVGTSRPNAGLAKGAKAGGVPEMLDIAGPGLIAAAGPRQTVREVYWRIGGHRVAISPLTLGLWAWLGRTESWAELAGRLAELHRRRRLWWRPSVAVSSVVFSGWDVRQGDGPLLLTDVSGTQHAVATQALLRLLGCRGGAGLGR